MSANRVPNFTVLLRHAALTLHVLFSLRTLHTLRISCKSLAKGLDIRLLDYHTVTLSSTITNVHDKWAYHEYAIQLTSTPEG